MLKDLRSADGVDKQNASTGSFGANSKSLFPDDAEKLYEDRFRKYGSVESDRRITMAEELAKSDPYYESGAAGGGPATSDPFETSFANFAAFDGAPSTDEPRRSPPNYRKSPASVHDHPSGADPLHGMLKSSAAAANHKSAYRPMFAADDAKQPPAESFLPKGGRTRRNEARSGDDGVREKIVINLRRVLSSADDTDKENDSPVMEDGTALRNLEPASLNRAGDASSDSFESIPEPPPRPIASPTAAQPPPLPPKKLQLPIVLKPPPRPSTDVSAHYDYIENYESLGSRQKLNGDVTIPPLPAPVRRPRCGLMTHRDAVRHRPCKQYASCESEYYLTPISKSRAEKEEPRPRKTSTVKPSLNITISQLTSTGFEDLANMLRIPASALSKMTLKELTECLSRLSDAECQKLESEMSNRNRDHGTGDGHGYRSLKESSFEDESTGFKANFEDRFSERSATAAPASATSNSAAQVDKYAVFRELIEQEEMNQQRLDKRSPSPDVVEETLSSAAREGEEESPREEEKEKFVLPKAEPTTATSPESKEEIPEEPEEKVVDETASQPEPDETQSADEVVSAAARIEIESSEVPGTPSDDKDVEDGPKPVDETSVKTNDGHREARDVKSLPENELGQNWAKFDSEQTPVWREENKVSDFGYEREAKVATTGAKPPHFRRPRPRRKWNDDEDEDDDDLNDEDYGDDSEENWEGSKRSLGSSWDESSWRENGWSDRDSLYDDAEASPASYREHKYHPRRKGYQRRFRSDDHSPWEEEAIDWHTRKPLYHKDGEPLYDDRKMRSSPWSGDRKRYETDEDDLKILKMVLGKKRLKALEEQLFKHYHEQLSEPPKKSYYHYAKSSSKESPADDEYVEIGGRPRHPKKYYTQRPKSADKSRKQALKLRPEDTEELFCGKKYRRPYSHDELSISEEERWARRSPAYPKAASTSSRSRNQSQTSPFEDNFTSQMYEFTDSPSETASSTHAKSKTLRYPGAGKKGGDGKRSLELHPYSTYDFKSGRSSRESSQRQSPFEDDFAPPELQKEAAKQTGDDAFYGAGGGSESGRSSRNNPRMSRMSRHDYQKRADKVSKYYENVELRKKMPDSYYEKIAKEKYKYGVGVAEKNDDGGELKSPKKNKPEGRRHDPFNDSSQSYDSKTVPRLQKVKNKVQNYESESDSAENDGPKWKDMSSFNFTDQHGRK